MSTVTSDEGMFRIVGREGGYTDGSPLSGKDTLDQLIEYCQDYGISVSPPILPEYDRVVRVGSIAFWAGSHSTGCDVAGWILDESSREAYQFISTPYWYSSHYTFNKSKWVRGAWDAAVLAAIEHLRAEVTKHRQRQEEARKAKDATKAQAEADLRARFGAQFTGAQS